MGHAACNRCIMFAPLPRRIASASRRVAPSDPGPEDRLEDSAHDLEGDKYKPEKEEVEEVHSAHSLTCKLV